MNERRILVIDDDRAFCASICDGLTGRGYQARYALDGEDGLAEYRRWHAPVVLLDQNLPNMTGLEVCRRLHELAPEVKVIFATAFGSYSRAVEAVKAGAYEYLPKPLDLDQFYLTVRNAFETHRLERRELLSRYERQKSGRADELTGVSPQANRIRRLVELAAASRSPVLITGETGVGKAVVARAIHKRSDEESYLTVNCAAVPESLMEAELFGHEKGAFTGATKRRKGVFELTHGGSLVLDEIGEMPLLLQKKLLTVLEEGRLRPLGGEEELSVDVRVIAITNRNLETEIEAQRFRADLYYRLAVIKIHVPPLRERTEDLEPLARVLLRRLTGRPCELPPEQLQVLRAYPWPGNTRELRNVLERSLILGGEKPDPASLLQPADGHPASVEPPGNDGEIPPLETVERQHILTVLERLDGNRRKTADTLGLSISTLRRRLNDYRRAGFRVPPSGA
ncbi:MAG: response regulator [Candidatus Coatesbacteria bacterium]|nr:response regulator [Candidatus Coatesbacteria bacterium]